MELQTYYDPEIDLASFTGKTFAFDYTNKENPLLEKELFGILRKELEKKGFVYSKEKPHMLITINSYIGRKETYVPPQTIVSTTYNHVWTMGMVGLTPSGQTQVIPNIQSETEPGQTIVSYYKNICLTFLDATVLASGKMPTLPPIIWKGIVEFIDDKNDPVSDIRIAAPYMMRALLEEFPIRSGKSQQRDLTILRYGMLGLEVDPNDWRKVTKVIQGYPADIAGIIPGDMIIAVNGKKMAKGIGDYSNYGIDMKAAFMLNDPYNLFVFYNKDGHEIELTIKKVSNGQTKKMRVIPIYGINDWLR
jgi:hypothetical protein